MMARVLFDCDIGTSGRLPVRAICSDSSIVNGRSGAASSAPMPTIVHVLDVEIGAFTVFRRLHRMPHIGWNNDECAWGRDTAVLSDDGIDLSSNDEDQQFIRMIMKFRTGSRVFLVQTKIQMTSLDDRSSS